MVLERPAQFLLDRSDEGAVRDKNPVRSRSNPEFRQVLLYFARKFNVPEVNENHRTK